MDDTRKISVEQCLIIPDGLNLWLEISQEKVQIHDCVIMSKKAYAKLLEQAGQKGIDPANEARQAIGIAGDGLPDVVIRDCICS